MGHNYFFSAFGITGLVFSSSFHWYYFLIVFCPILNNLGDKCVRESAEQRIFKRYL